ncbi:MAG: long-chain fatty acid--CoA ligase [Myxococcota bacterium]
MSLDWLFDRLRSFGDDEAILFGDRRHTYRDLVEAIAREGEILDRYGIGAGDVVMLEGDFAPRSIALLLCLAARRAIIAPLAPGAIIEAEALIETCQANFVIAMGEADAVRVEKTARARAEHALYETLRGRQTPGLLIFTSGSTGKSKAVVHDFGAVFEKFIQPKQKARTLSFLLFDHIGGLNTLIQTLSAGGALIIPKDHDPETVALAVERWKVELLPVSPTFLNLLLMSGAHERHDLRSLKVVSYGTEPMPETTLRRATEALPWARFHQLYGLSEMGILRSKVRDQKGLWVQVGGEGVQTRIADGMLEIKARSAMLGYLNAPSPFTEDGWLKTGDEVEVDGEWIRIKGRRSEMINVGGQKVFPAEVENVIAEMENIQDVVVFGEAHPMMGHVVACRVNLVHEEEPRALRARIRKHCGEHLASFKVPVKVEITTEALYSARMKRVRPKGP